MAGPYSTFSFKGSETRHFKEPLGVRASKKRPFGKNNVPSWAIEGVRSALPGIVLVFAYCHSRSPGVAPASRQNKVKTAKTNESRTLDLTDPDRMNKTRDAIFVQLGKPRLATYVTSTHIATLHVRSTEVALFRTLNRSEGHLRCLLPNAIKLGSRLYRHRNSRRFAVGTRQDRTPRRKIV